MQSRMDSDRAAAADKSRAANTAALSRIRQKQRKKIIPPDPQFFYNLK